MLQKLILALGAAAAACHAAFPQEQRQFYSVEQGLPSAAVRAVVVSEAGVVYAGTAAGLARLMGERFQLIRPEPVDLLAVRGAQLIAVAGGDLILFGNDAVETRVPLPMETPRALAACQDVWLGAGRLFVLSGSTLQPVRGAPDAVQSVACAPDGRVALGARDGLYVGRKDGVWTRLFPVDGKRSWAPRDVRAVAFDPDGVLWFASPQGAGVWDGAGWRLMDGTTGLPYDDFTALAAGRKGAVWFGTRIGAMRYDSGAWRYRQGRRWLPDDHVRGVAVAADGGAWLATGAGLSRISFAASTLAAKARWFEDEIDRRHRRTPYGFVLEVSTARPGDATIYTQHDSDNDGLWTAMYGAGACFACAATADPAACRRAQAAFEALKFLGDVTQGGSHPAPPGFVARTVLPTSGPDPNAGDYTPEKDQQRQRRDSLWKVMRPRWPKSADGQWYWKSDTSSDELDGHYFFYALYYDLAARTEAEKQRVRTVVRAMTDHLIDHGFRYVDHDGRPTRWGIFDPAHLNRDRLWWEERGLNSLSMLAYLKIAEHMTGDARYTRAIALLREQHGYDMNLMYPKAHAGPATGNHSDDEMAFMNYYHLLKYERDEEMRQRVGLSLQRYWQLEAPEKNPFFNYVYAAVARGLVFQDSGGAIALGPENDRWRSDALDTLQRFPLDRFNWGYRNSHRLDVVPLPWRSREGSAVGARQDGSALPVDERYVMHWNHDPWRLDYAGSGTELADGAAFLLPYYMGLYHGFLEKE